MEPAQPRGLNRRRVALLLSATRREPSLAGRIEILSRSFIGHPYKSNPLIGSADTNEVLVASIDEFDCVTYIETVLALARASSAEDFVRWLRKLRYADGRVRWDRRNHYMMNWLRNNTRQRLVRPVSFPRIPLNHRHRVLNAVAGLPVQRAQIKCVPKPAVSRVAPRLISGDLIFFASTRKNLDVFHAGIIVRHCEKVLMRHASRSKGGVVEQDVQQFLKTNRMAGVIVVRPREASRRSA